jgi:hypothetical protein
MMRAFFSLPMRLFQPTGAPFFSLPAQQYRPFRLLFDALTRRDALYAFSTLKL